MKEFLAIAFNPMLSEVDGGLMGTGELVLVHSEPRYVDGGSQQLRQDKIKPDLTVFG